MLRIDIGKQMGVMMWGTEFKEWWNRFKNEIRVKHGVDPVEYPYKG